MTSRDARRPPALARTVARMLVAAIVAAALLWSGLLYSAVAHRGPAPPSSSRANQHRPSAASARSTATPAPLVTRAS